VNNIASIKALRPAISGALADMLSHMDIRRRELIAGTLALLGAGSLSTASAQGEKRMYGLIGKMMAVPGQRDALIAILLEGTQSMPGCLAYIVAEDANDPNGIWITEVWDSKESHGASLKLPEVRNAIAKAKPIIAGFGESFVTTPVGGVGLNTPKSG
jgi:quinol monooxygenase YgiN